MTRSLRSRWSILGILSLAVGLSPAAAEFPRAWPPELHFGKVRVGARVEGTFRALLDETDPYGGAIEAKPPEGMKIDEISVGQTEVTGPNALVYRNVRVGFTVDTSEAGEQTGKLELRIGGTRRNIPFSITVVEPSESAIRVLVLGPPVSEHSNAVDVYAPWNVMIDEGNFDPTYIDQRPPRSALPEIELADYDVVLIASIAVWHGWGEQETEDLKAFIENGGRVVLFTMGRFTPTGESIKPLIEAAGIGVASGSVFPPSQGRTAEAQIADDPLTRGIKFLAWGNPASLKILDPARAKLLTAQPQDDSRGLAAVGKLGEGEMVVVAEANPWFWTGNAGPRSADNSALMRNFLTVGLPREKKPEAPVAPAEEATP